MQSKKKTEAVEHQLRDRERGPTGKVQRSQSVRHTGEQGKVGHTNQGRTASRQMCPRASERTPNSSKKEAK